MRDPAGGTAGKGGGCVHGAPHDDAALKKSARGGEAGYVKLVVEELSQWANLRERVRTISQLMGFSGQAFSAEI